MLRAERNAPTHERPMAPAAAYAVSVYDYATPGAVMRCYYPAGGKEGGKAKGVRWLPHRMYLYGYQVFLLNVIGNVENPRPLWARALIELPLTLLVTPIMYIWFCLFVAPIQASSCEPLLEPPDGKKWPVVVFSHGLAGHRSAYSELCTRLARRGVFVAALEHMDGSASMSACCTGSTSSEHVFPHWLQYVHSNGTRKWRVGQLDLRAKEVNHALYIIRKWASATPAELNCAYWMSPTFQSERELSHHFWHKLDADNAVIAGHSFGAATAIRCLGLSPFACAVLFDPWMLAVDPEEHACGEKPVVALNSDRWNPALLGMQKRNSDVWREYTSRRTAPTPTLEVAGTSHIDHSDFPIKIGWSAPLPRVSRSRARTPAHRMLEVCADFAHAAVVGRGSSEAFQSAVGDVRGAHADILQPYSWDASAGAAGVE